MKKLKDLKASKHPSNEERTAVQLKKFDNDRMLRSLITAPKPLIFDVGAYTGKSMIDFVAIFPDARIVAFEPNTQAIDDLKIVAGSYSILELIERAVTNASRRAKFYQQGIDPGFSGLIPAN